MFLHVLLFIIAWCERVTTFEQGNEVISQALHSDNKSPTHAFNGGKEKLKKLFMYYCGGKLLMTW